MLCESWVPSVCEISEPKYIYLDCLWVYIYFSNVYILKRKWWNPFISYLCTYDQWRIAFCTVYFVDKNKRKWNQTLNNQQKRTILCVFMGSSVFSDGIDGVWKSDVIFLCKRKIYFVSVKLCKWLWFTLVVQK